MQHQFKPRTRERDHMLFFFLFHVPNVIKCYIDMLFLVIKNSHTRTHTHTHTHFLSFSLGIKCQQQEEDKRATLLTTYFQIYDRGCDRVVKITLILIRLYSLKSFQSVTLKYSILCTYILTVNTQSGYKLVRYKPGAGNYFRPRATLCIYLSLAGHIQVKKAMTMLRKLAFAGRMWPAGRMLPPPGLECKSWL